MYLDAIKCNDSLFCLRLSGKIAALFEHPSKNSPSPKKNGGTTFLIYVGSGLVLRERGVWNIVETRQDVLLEKEGKGESKSVLSGHGFKRSAFQFV